MKTGSVRVAAVAMALAAFGLCAGVRAEDAKQDAGKAASTGMPAAPAVTAGASAADERVKVSNATPPNGGADGRVSVGGVKISRARLEGTGASQDSAGASNAAIVVPNNTLGPGESLQQRNERISAENRRVEAEAAIAEREAARPALDRDERDTLIVFGSHGRSLWHGGGWGGWNAGGRWHRPRGEVTTEVIGFEDQVHGKALKHFSDAAAAGTGRLGDAQREAILNFGRATEAALQPMVEGQRARDAAQLRMQKAK